MKGITLSESVQFWFESIEKEDERESLRAAEEIDGIEPIYKKDLTQEEVRQCWIEALESGEYRQGKRYLHTVEEIDGETVNKYCCLGVATDLYQKYVGGLKEWHKYGVIVYEGQPRLASQKVVDWLGLQSDMGCYENADGHSRSLAVDNDMDKTFKDIAHRLRSDPARYFTP